MKTQRLDEGLIIEASNNLQLKPADIQQVIASSKIPDSLKAGIVISLNEQEYRVNQLISANTGEAEIYQIQKDETDFVLKYYYSHFKPKDETLIKLKNIDHPGIIKLFDFGYLSGRFFEIMEYAKGGTLNDDMPINTNERIKFVLQQIVEALHCCHQNNIIHKDIKPENIFYRDKEKAQLALADFGIASNIQQGEDIVKTKTARTNLYAAPELFMGFKGEALLDASIDYYALGITILYLYSGVSPFKDVDEYSIMRRKLECKITFPQNIDAATELLIKGLITVNPKDRWGYNQIISWLKGEDIKVKYYTTAYEYTPYSYGVINGEKVYVNTPEDLAYYLERYPEIGEGHLYRNTLAKWVQNTDQGLFNSLMDIVELEYPNNKQAGLTKAIYLLDQNKSFSGFDHTILKSPREIGDYFEKNFEYYCTELQKNDAPFYIFLDSRDMKDVADEYRGLFIKFNPIASLNQIILNLQLSKYGDFQYVRFDAVFYQPTDLLRVDSNVQDMLAKDLGNPNSKLSVWITNFPEYFASVNTWRKQELYNNTTLPYALQMGFIFNDSYYKDTREFEVVFNENFSTFFKNDEKSISLRDEAAYWLQTYCNTTLGAMVVDLLGKKRVKDEELTSAYKFVLDKSNKSDAIYNYIEKFSLVENIQSDEFLLSAHKNILSYWDFANQNDNKCYKDSINGFISFVKKFSLQNELFANQLITSLDGDLYNKFRSDVGYVNSLQEGPGEYLESLFEIADDLCKFKKDLQFLKNIIALKQLVCKLKEAAKNEIKEERQRKENEVHTEFRNVVEQRGKEFNKSEGKRKRKTLSLYLATAIFLFSFFIWHVLFGNSINFETWSYLIVEIVFIVFGLVLLFIYNRMATKQFEKIIIWFAGAGLLFSNSIRPLTNILAVGGAAVFGYLYYTVRAKYHEQIGTLDLSNQEQEYLKQNMQNIETSYSEKELWQVNKEISRILQLNASEIEKELN